MPRAFQYINVKARGFCLLKCFEGMLQTTYSGERGERSETKTVDSGQESRSKSRLVVSITLLSQYSSCFNNAT